MTRLAEKITIAFVANREIKDTLERWAREDDRSISYVLREIIKAEMERRRASDEKT